MVVEKQQILYGSDVAAPTIFKHGRTVSVLNTIGSGLPWEAEEENLNRISSV